MLTLAWKNTAQHLDLLEVNTLRILLNVVMVLSWISSSTVLKKEVGQVCGGDFKMLFFFFYC